MLTQISAFLNDYAALEKTLRFLQGTTLICPSVAPFHYNATSWLQARSHIGIARRFFRLHKWIDCSHAAFSAFSNQDLFFLLWSLTILKQSTLSIYLFLEMFTITDALGLTSFPWGQGLFREAQKFWFYAIAISALQQLYALYMLNTSAKGVAAASKNSKHGSGKQDEGRRKANKANSRKLYKQLVSDCLDLLIPGSFLGWVKIDPLYVGIAMCTGSLLSMSELWSRINRL